MEIPLLLLRDILTNWDQSPILNAARAQEARAIYANLDRLIPKRIVPTELGRMISEADINGTLFFVQQKIVANPDSYSPPGYAVIWAREDWLASTECRLSKTDAWATERQAMLLRSANEDRIKRIAKRITAVLPIYKHILPVLESMSGNEVELKRLCDTLKTHLNIDVYEPPQDPENPHQDPEVGSTPGPAPAPDPQPVKQNRFLKSQAFGQG